MNTVAAMVLAALLPMGAEAETFLPGFPDVPVLECCREHRPDERIVFDTPSGTVAETSLLSTESVADSLSAYDKALAGLGWTCARTGPRLSCLRGGYSLSVKGRRNAGKQTVLILSASPAAKP